jgi:hypothetical protein
MYDLKNAHTTSMIARRACIAFAGGNGCKKAFRAIEQAIGAF